MLPWDITRCSGIGCTKASRRIEASRSGRRRAFHAQTGVHDHPMRLHPAAPVILLWCCAVSSVAQESVPAEEWPFCPAGIPIPERPGVEDALEAGDIHVLADQAD